MTTAMSTAQLLQVPEPEFDSAVQSMTLKDLLEMITVLQKEMAKEQETFNSLSADLGTLKRNSGQYKTVSKDMNASQARLTMLMNRSMKCFSQQSNQQSVPRRNSMGSSGVRLQRSNSAHEKVDTSAKTNVSRPNRNSMADVIDFKVDKQPAKSGHLTNGDKAPLAKQETQTSVVQIRSLKPDQSGPVKRTSVEVKSMKSDSDSIPRASHSTMNEARSKLKTVFNSQNIDTLPNKNFSTQLNVSSNVNRSQTFASGDVKRLSNGLQFDAGNTDSSADSDKSNNTETVSDNKLPTPKETGKVTGVDKVNKTNVTLGPMASHKKFISTSTGNIHLNSEKSNIEKHKPEIVKGYQPVKPKSAIVMSHDKQMIDLDSFTTRKNMLAEIKQFDKELKHTKTKDSGESKVKEIGSMSGGSYKVAEKNGESAAKPNLMSEIKLSKKPSEIVNAREQKQTVRTENIETTKDVAKESNKSSKVTFDLPPTKEQTKTVSRIETPSTASEDTVDAQMQKFDDLLNVSDDDKVAPHKKTTHDEQLSSVSTIDVPREVIADPSQTTTVKEEKHLDKADRTKKDDEDEERFVTSFQFPQMRAKEVTQSKPVKKEAPVIQKDVVQSSSTASAAPVKGQGEIKQTTQSSRAVANGDEEEEEVAQQARINLIDWDPSTLLSDLYKVEMMPDTTVDISHRFIGMEGLMEKLPMNKKKATLLKTWKRRFFRAADGWLHYYETGSRDKPSDSLQLMGGKVEELGPRVLGVDDGRGKYLMVRVPTDQEYGQWRVALESQTADNVKATYVTPVLESPPHPKKKVIILDIGSSSIRAGILGEKPTLPQLFFPTIVAVNKQTGELTVGADAYKPSVRKFSTITQPIRPTNKVDKFNMDMDLMPEIFKKVFTDLKVNPREYLVMLSTPQKLGDNLKASLMKILLEQFHIRGICMVPQALLALYSYNSTSGVIVDIGERMDILPIYDGLLIEGGVSHQSYGGAKVQDSLYLDLLQNRYKLNTTVEKLLVRHICEEACYIAENYKEAIAKCERDPQSYKTTVFLSNFSLPEGAYMSVDLDLGCFKSPEGFFNTDLWGMDYPNIHKLIYQGIQQSPMDARKHMYRSVYLSGGVTMIPGFAERLESELRKLAPPTVIVEVHASPQRYHAAYIGACAVAAMDVFEQSCVSAEEWKKLGIKACRKWGTG